MSLLSMFDVWIRVSTSSSNGISFTLVVLIFPAVVSGLILFANLIDASFS